MTVLDRLAGEYPGRPLRAVIQAWNARNLRFATNPGFICVGELASPQNGQQVSYQILVRPRIAQSNARKAAL